MSGEPLDTFYNPSKVKGTAICRIVDCFYDSVETITPQQMVHWEPSHSNKEKRSIDMLAKVTRTFRRFVRLEEGLETVEYAIITGLIVAATIVAIAAIGAWVLAQFQALQAGLGA